MLSAKESRSRTRISRRKSPPPEAKSERLNRVPQSRPFIDWTVVTRGKRRSLKSRAIFRCACLLFTFDLRGISREARKSTWPLRLRAPREEDLQGDTNVGSPFLIARVFHGFGRVRFGAVKGQLGPRCTPPMQRKIPGRQGGGHVER